MTFDVTRAGSEPALTFFRINSGTRPFLFFYAFLDSFTRPFAQHTPTVNSLQSTMERLKGEGVQDWLSQHLTSPWHGHQTVASELGNEIISNIHDRWTHLGPSVQLGVLFSIISLKKAQQLQLKGTCQRVRPVETSTYRDCCHT